MLAAGAAALLLTAGCAANPGTTASQAPTAVGAPTTINATAAATASASSTAPTGTPAAGVQKSYKYAEPIVLGAWSVKAGESLSVSGGTLTPGAAVKVYAAQQMTATYNPATDMWGSAEGEVLISDTVTAMVDAQGHYDVQLVIRAGTPPQTFNVQLILPDGNGHLLQANVE